MVDDGTGTRAWSSASMGLGARERGWLRASAGLLAILVAWLHLLHPEYGTQRLLLYVELGTLYDPRPPLFVLSGLAIFVGVVLAFYDVYRRPIYLAGIALMLTYLLGYVAWHTVLNHGAFWPHIEPHHHHDVGVLESMVDHLRADVIALVSKTAEVTLLAVLFVLYLGDDDNGQGDPDA